MANFATHIGVGTLVSGALATATVASGTVSPENVIGATLAGIIGSVLPDIDLEESRPSRAMFSGLAVMFAFAVLFAYASRYSIAELLILLIGAFLLVRYGLQAVFYAVAKHRGIWHSLLAAVFSAVTAAVVFYYVLDRPAGAAWLAGAFLFVGFITHLVLDEIYAVDMLDRHIKKSFGTALKLIDRHHPAETAVMAAATLLVCVMAPSPGAFWQTLAAPALWTGLEQRLVPHDKWFGFVNVASSKPQSDPSGNQLTTGSLRDRQEPSAK